MFQRRSVKHAHLLLRHAEKVRRYRRDVMSEQALVDLDRHITELKAAARARNDSAIREKSEQLEQMIGHQAAGHWEAGWRENTEVILVAIVVAVAVRSYFIQPFKIPTGSMQPTLNGIIGHPQMKPAPNILQQVAEFFILGRDYINVVSQVDDTVDHVEPRKFLFFFTWSRLICHHQQISIYCPPDTLMNDFKVTPGASYKKGAVIARGAVDTGDQVFVDKFSYNFIKPHRGDVFVFRTNHIFMIREDPETGAPYYIKRLAGVPGDTLRISPPLLYVNGEPPKRFGFQRVMEAKAPYRGYSLGGANLANPHQTFTVPAHAYFAMGDNSYFSFDSRYWGPVPEENLVGRGLMVYWPFNRHWGLIR
ncbi:MAG: signal peptidase I [Chthoniobacterales bacterium]|nr:MAG: signal peptidase I [Chthoniobacterales bacterium]